MICAGRLSAYIDVLAGPTTRRYKHPFIATISASTTAAIITIDNRYPAYDTPKTRPPPMDLLSISSTSSCTRQPSGVNMNPLPIIRPILPAHDIHMVRAGQYNLYILCESGEGGPLPTSRSSRYSTDSLTLTLADSSPRL